MKREVKKFALLLFATALLFMPSVLFGQEPQPPPIPPTSWVDVIGNFNTWFATLAGVAAVTVFVAGFITTIFKVSATIWKQVIAWLVAIGFVFIGNIFKIGFVAGFPWLTTLIYGFAAGLVANGLFDINLVQSLLNFLNLKKVKKV